jgi:hypothetical protein
MDRGTDLNERLKKALVKLYTLRDSCWGVIIFQRYPPDFSWFEAAAGICAEAEDRIREAGRFLAESKDETSH